MQPASVSAMTNDSSIHLAYLFILPLSSGISPSGMPVVSIEHASSKDETLYCDSNACLRLLPTPPSTSHQLRCRAGAKTTEKSVALACYYE
jgi:hypothetical protein